MKRKNRLSWIRITLAFLLVLIVAGGLYVISGVYQPDETAVSALESTETVRVERMRDGYAFLPDGAENGVIFYPGAKVSCAAYAPLMQKIADRGIACVLLRLPGNLAIFEPGAANKIPERFPEIKNWYLAGHSLGGSMAAACLNSSDRYSGLILLASYSTKNLTAKNVPVLSLYGSEDGVLKMNRYEKNRANLPNLTETVIKGGNHAGFGCYGAQRGDNPAAISADEQQTQTADAIAAMILK